MRTTCLRPLLLATSLAAAMVLTGCPKKLETKVVHPRTVWTFYDVATDYATTSCLFNCSFEDLKGATPGPLPPGRFRVGYDHRYDEGTLPCNCWQTYAIAYRGAVRFDLLDVPKNFVSATLRLKPWEAEFLEGSTASNDESGTIAGIWLASTQWYLGISTPVFVDGNGTESAQLDAAFPPGSALVVPFPENPGPEFSGNGRVKKVGSTYAIDVSDQLRSWQKDKEPNRGFVFTGRDESLALKENRIRTAQYEVWLEVLFNPELQ